ncbi:MAG: hypothetical protein Q7T92_01250 [Lutibacter sp.]|nr:hypothetical protein [Lutibacter sp.]
MIFAKNLGLPAFLEGLPAFLEGLPAFLEGVPAEKAGVLSAAIFFLAKNLKKGFPLQSLTRFK